MARTSLAARLHAAVRIHREILSGTYPSASDLARILETTPKTARSYLRILSDSFGLQPVYDAAQYGYCYLDGTGTEIVPRLGENEVAAVFLFDQAIRTYQGTPVEPLLQGVLDKLALTLPPGSGISMDQVVSAMSLRPEKAEASSTPTDVLNVLYEAIRSQSCVSILYKGRDRQRARRREVDPLHLTRCEGQWYLVAYCHLRDDLRVFVPARIRKIETTAKNFQRPDDFDPEEYFRTAFGIVAGKDVGPVSLRFARSVAPIIRERRWHATQEIEDLADGQVRLRMTCSQSDELIAWLMSWGSNVEIEKPLALARDLCKAHRWAAEKGI